MNLNAPQRLRAVTIGACLATAIIGNASLAEDETAGSKEISFNIPAQPAAKSLNLYAEQASKQILFPYAAVEDIETNAVVGEFDEASALDMLLVDTGLEAVYGREGTVTVRLIAAGAAATDPPPGKTRPASSRATTARGTTSAENRNGDAGSRDSRRPVSAYADALQMEEIVVTGSRIRNAIPTSRVITFDREEIERGGYASVQDLFKQIPQNFGSSTPVSGGSNLGKSSQIDLRGFGSKSSLTLVNGRRVSSAGGDRGRAVDVSMIPLAAIERIEILTDGASALYGSDAIGGVTNILLRKDFTGSETSVQYGDNSTGSDDFMVAEVLGTSWGSGRMLATAQYRRNDALTYQALGINTLDFRSRGGSDQRAFGLGDANSNGTVLTLTGLPFTTPGTPPGTVSATLPTGDGRSLTLDQLGINQISTGDYGLADLAPEEEDVSGYFLLEQDIGSVTLFADGVYSHRTSASNLGGIYTAFVVPPGCGFTGGGPCNPFSPFAEPVLVYNRLDEFGPVLSDVERNGWFANVGARGEFGSSDWNWEAVGTLSEDESETTIPFAGQPQPVELTNRLANPDPALAFNPFDDGTGQSPGVVDALQLPTRTEGRTTLTEGSVLAEGSLWQNAGGAVRLAVGASYREEELKEIQLQLGGTPFVSPSFGVAVNGSRDVSAVFAELYLPLIGDANARSGARQLAFSAAARYESYSDFGETVNPKLGFVWRPIEDLTLKANWGTSFRAPSLIELFATVVEQQVPLFDPNAPAGTPPVVVVTRMSGGNLDLQEETAETYTIGGEYHPNWLEGSRFALNWFHTDYEDRIRGSLDGLNTSALFQYEDVLPPGIIVRDGSGILQSIFITNINTAETIASGYDVMAGYSWETERYGGFDVTASVTLYEEYEDRLVDGAPTIDLLGIVGSVPERRGRIGFGWFSGAWGASIAANHTDAFWNTGNAQVPLVRRDVASQTVVDIQLSFASPASSGWLRGFSARIGARNLFDRRPPFVDGQNNGIDTRNATLEGRTVYLRLSKSFGEAVAN